MSKSDETSDTVTVENKGSLRYLFSEQWSMSINGAFATTDFEAGDVSKKLDENSLGAELILQMSGHNSLSLHLKQEDISSDDNILDYRQNEVRLNWRYIF